MKKRATKKRFAYKYVVALLYKNHTERYIGCKNLDTLAVIMSGLWMEKKSTVIGFQVLEFDKAKKKGWDLLIHEVADVLNKKTNKKSKGRQSYAKNKKRK